MQKIKKNIIDYLPHVVNRAQSTIHLCPQVCRLRIRELVKNYKHSNKL